MHSLTDRVCITITKKTADCRMLIILVLLPDLLSMLRPYQNRLKRELGSETQMTEERSRSPGQKLVQKQLSDFCQCLETGALIAVSCNANHPACHTSSKICFAPVFLFPRPEYCGLVIVTFSLVTSNCYVTAHQLFTTICLPGAQK